MSPRFSTYPHDLTDTIRCPKCGNSGVISWDYVPTPSGPQKDFAGISGDFYERLSSKPPYPIEIVCSSCRIAVVPERPWNSGDTIRN
jgi:hypothetical protein